METRICLAVLCGIPGSGKSSICDRFNRDLGNCYLIININYDDILLSSDTDTIQFHQHILDIKDKTGDNSLVKPARQQVVKLVEIVIQNLRKHGSLTKFDSSNGMEYINEDIQKSFLGSWQRSFCTKPEGQREVLILVDDNMYLSSMRYDFYKLARQYGTGFCEIFMDTPFKIALQRNLMRKGRDVINQEVIEKMSQKIEPPNPIKNHWEKYSIGLKTEENASSALLMLEEAFANPVQPLTKVDEGEQAQSQAVCSKNLVHQADLILRQCVAKAISNGKKNSLDVRLLSKQAMAVKEHILNAIKSGDVKIYIAESLTVDASKDENCDLYKYVYKLFSEKLKT